MLYTFITESYLALVPSKHRHICLNNSEIGDTYSGESRPCAEGVRGSLDLPLNHIRFEENMSKTIHGGLLDLKYEPRAVKHACHDDYTT